MENKEILYIGLELTHDSAEKLLKVAKSVCTDIWRNSEREYKCHHMTIAFRRQIDQSVMEWFEKNEGKEFVMTAEKIGVSDKAVAVEVSTDCMSKNNIKHVTLAVNKSKGGKPVDSNGIKKWIKMKQPIRLKGKVKAYYK